MLVYMNKIFKKVWFKLMKNSNLNVLVLTGGTQGIGRACLKRFCEGGWRVHVLARREPLNDFLWQEYGEKQLFFHAVDLTDVTGVESVAKQLLAQEAQGIDLVLSNAGSGIAGSLENTPLEKMKTNYELHVWGALLLVQKLLPALRIRQGRIYFMSSLAAEIPIPFQAIYAIAKAGLKQLAYCWDMELRPFGVRVGLIMPGDVRTEFTANRRLLSEDGVYTALAKRAITVMERDEEKGMQPEEIAAAVWRAANSKRFKQTIIPGLKYQFLYLLWRFLPRRFTLFLIRNLYKIAQL